jgi:crotonobetaine/carnitine-CoA ligase
MSDLPAQFPPAERTVPAMLQRQAQRFGDRALFTAGDMTWSFAQACDVAARRAGALKALGIGLGDRVAIVCANRAELMEVFLGCAWVGAIAVPLNTACKGPQLQYLLGNSGARLLVIDAEFVPALALVDVVKVSLEAVWVIGDAAAPVEGIRCRPFPPPGEAIAPAPTRPGDLLAILYTSGTTGPSKGVCCPHAQYFWWAVQTGGLLGVREGDVLCTSLPLFHTNALNSFFQALLNGATLAVERRFSASGFWRALIERRATVTYVLGAMVPILLAKEPSADERAHRVRVALAPGVPAHLHKAFAERSGIALLDGYGSTETNHVIGVATEARLGAMGKVCPGFDARVVDEDDNELPPGQAGELILRADEPFAFAIGYYNMPQKTVEAWRNLWFHTGDRVMRDADGYFFFVDRLKDAIRRRGENISSFEVEQVLLSHPAIETAAVFPVRSELAEDEVMCAIVLRGGAALDAPTLLDFCQPRLPYFAIPRFVEFIDDLPKTENGKIQKYKLRDRGLTSTTWDREKAGYKIVR